MLWQQWGETLLFNRKKPTTEQSAVTGWVGGKTNIQRDLLAALYVYNKVCNKFHLNCKLGVAERGSSNDAFPISV